MAMGSLSSRIGAPPLGAPGTGARSSSRKRALSNRRVLSDCDSVDRDLSNVIGDLTDLDLGQLSLRWRNHLSGAPPAHLPRWLLVRLLAYRIQAAAFGDLDKASLRRLRQPMSEKGAPPHFVERKPLTKDGVDLNPGALLVREWKGRLERVMILEKGFAWNGSTYSSLSMAAKAITGTSWNGHRFFGLRKSDAA